jgi:hypothetical protein
MSNEDFILPPPDGSEPTYTGSDVTLIESDCAPHEPTLTTGERSRYERLQAEIKAMITIEEERARKTSSDEADDDLLLPL